MLARPAMRCAVPRSGRIVQPNVLCVVLSETASATVLLLAPAYWPIVQEINANARGGAVLPRG
jgi:hypothetical protein